MQEWPFNVELGQAAQPDAHSGLEPIPEEASGRPPKMSSVAGCLLFALGLESAGNSFKDAIPTGQCLIPAYHYFETSTHTGPVLSDIMAAEVMRWPLGKEEKAAYSDRL